MKYKLILSSLLFSASLCAAASDGMAFVADKKGLHLGGEQLRVQINGALLLDGDYREGLYENDNPLAEEPGFEHEIRRAELSFRFKFQSWAYAKYKTVYDDDRASLVTRDAFIGVKFFEGWKLQAGKMKQPFGLERSTSTRKLLMIERSMLSSSLSPKRSTGLKLAYDGDRLNWGLGAFERDVESSDKNIDSLSSRLTFNLLNEKRHHWHIGASYNIRNYNGSEHRIKTRAEVHTASKFLKTKKMAAEEHRVIGLETGFTYYGLLLQAEYMLSDISSNQDSLDYDIIDQEHQGYYFQAAYVFRKRGHRYKKSKLNSYNSYKRGKRELRNTKIASGSWELVARYSSLDAYDDVEDNGFVAATSSVGVNYYWGHYFRVMANVSETDVSEGKHAELPARAVSMRVQMQF
ncbi:MAG: hypothetical protein HRU20_07445 [Pseudomonadales bacterium]|nr:hypothetical protein [Pseudomonadales bacterium]